MMAIIKFYGLPAQKKDGHRSGILLPLPNMAVKAHCLFWLCDQQWFAEKTHVLTHPLYSAEQSIVVDYSILNSLHPPVAFHCLNKDGHFLISIKYLLKYSYYSLFPQFRMQPLPVFLI